MSDTPPPELVDACARSELNWDERLSIEEGGEEPWLAAAPDDREVYREGVRRILAVLAEWADGGLIDPSTWTVVEAKPVDPEEVRGDMSDCPYLARFRCAPGYDPEASCVYGCRDEPECVTCAPSGGWPLERPLYTLFPREGER